jgi:hypothetical protein
VVIGSWLIKASNGGTAAPRSIASAALSSSWEPELRTTDTSTTRPEGCTVNRNVTVPCSPRRRASSGYILCDASQASNDCAQEALIRGGDSTGAWVGVVACCAGPGVGG